MCLYMHIAITERRTENCLIKTRIRVRGAESEDNENAYTRAWRSKG